jgi:hypothetical protein
MADFDWIRIGMSAAVGAVSGVLSAIATAYKFGRDGVRKEQSVKDDYDAKIDGLREEVRREVAAIKESSTEARDLLVDQFKETLDGLRRQFDAHQLVTEKEFLRKGEFKDFRDEYREDQRRTDDKLDKLLGMKS